MSKRARTRAGVTLAILGVVLACVEFGFYFRAQYHHEHYDINPYLMLAATVIAFVGGFIIDPQKAEQAGTFIVDTGLRVVAVIPTGRRAGDKKVVQLDPVAPPTDATPSIPTTPPTLP